MLQPTLRKPRVKSVASFTPLRFCRNSALELEAVNGLRAGQGGAAAILSLYRSFLFVEDTFYIAGQLILIDLSYTAHHKGYLISRETVVL